MDARRRSLPGAWFRQHPDQLAIGGWEAERGELVAGHPSHLLTEQRLRRTAQLAVIEKQRDGAIVVFVRRLKPEPLHVDIDAELFTQLSYQRLRVCLSRIDLSAGKLPQAFEV